ncbi:MAG: (2Fe-2S)-binding protein [Pseudomonadota bacterium]
MRRVNASERAALSFKLNGDAVAAEAPPRALLSDVLRHQLRATGTHVGCEHGVCGACTVRIDGALARSCLTLAIQADGAEIETVEGLAAPGDLSPLQQAFRENFALQCGFCTPGILMSLDTLLRDDPAADDEAIRDALSGHLCRCTGYEQIMAAARAAREAIDA